MYIYLIIYDGLFLLECKFHVGGNISLYYFTAVFSARGIVPRYDRCSLSIKRMNKWMNLIPTTVVKDRRSHNPALTSVWSLKRLQWPKVTEEKFLDRRSEPKTIWHQSSKHFMTYSVVILTILGLSWEIINTIIII